MTIVKPGEVFRLMEIGVGLPVDHKEKIVFFSKFVLRRSVKNPAIPLWLSPSLLFINVWSSLGFFYFVNSCPTDGSRSGNRATPSIQGVIFLYVMLKFLLADLQMMTNNPMTIVYTAVKHELAGQPEYGEEIRSTYSVCIKIMY